MTTSAHRPSSAPVLLARPSSPALRSVGHTTNMGTAPGLAKCRPMSPGSRLRHQREVAGMTQAQAAERLGIARRTLMRWEADDHDIDRLTALDWYQRRNAETG